MEINGVIVAKSEVFRLKSGYCCLLAIYNKCSDILLHLFIQGSRMLELKNKIQLNSCYKFFNLNYCSLKLISKKCVKVHQMGLASNYQEILEEDVHAVELMPFLEYVTEESRTSRDHSKETSKLISYEGCVTAVKDVALGIYELDKKLLLYTTFLKLHSDTPSLSKGHKVFICNAHYQKEKCLVCCGLSLVIVLESQGQKDDERYPELKLIDELGLCFRDFIWIERSFESLKSKFCSSIISYESNPFNWKSDHAITIIEGLMKCSIHAKTMNVLSRHCLIQEFISNPHSCVVTMQDKHNLYFEIPTISDILKMSKDDCEWNIHSKHWKTFVFNSTDNLVLIGMLQYHTDGTFYISDISGGAPVLFLQDDNESQDSCTVPCPRNIMCEISDKSIGFIVALKNFTLVFEECVDQALTTTNNVCICAKLQFLYILHKINYTVNDANVLQNVFDLPVTEKKCESSLYLSNKGKNFSSNVHHSLDGCILHNEINNVNYDKILGLSDLFQRYLSLDCSIEHEIVKKRIKMASPNDNVFCYVLVCSKTWPIFKNRELHQEAVVFLIGDQVFESSTSSDHILSVQYSNEYSLNMETPIDASNSFDQIEPSLVSEENSFEKNYYFRPMLLCFKNHSIRSCAILVQGHMYLMPISRNELKKVLCFYSDSKIKYGMMQELLLDEIISIDILTEAKFVHVQQSSNMKIPSCVQTLPFLMQKHGIDDILTKRSISKFSFIRGVLVKKWYENDMVSRSYSYEPADGHLHANKRSLCLELRDCSSSNTIRIYTPEYEGSFYGLIPGAVVQIFGLSCQCSKKGNIYLKSSGPIGINILKINSDFSNEASTSTGNQQKLFGQLQYSFRENPWSFLSKAIAGFKFYSSCFISCVLKVELFPVCAKCAENSPKDCFCSQSSVKAKASFIADDGSAQGFVYCADDTVRCLLNLTKPQWQIFLSYVQESEEYLLYNHHILPEDTISIIPSVFQAVCSSALIERQMILNCCAFPNSDKALSRYNSSYHKRDGPLMRFYCTFMRESKPREMSLHLFEHLKKQGK